MLWDKDDNPYKQWQKAYFSFLLTWVRRGLARDWAGQCHLDRWTRTWWESHCLQKRNWRGEHLQDMDINQAYQDMPCTLPESYPKWKQRKDQHRWRTGPWCRSRSPACSAAGSTCTGCSSINGVSVNYGRPDSGNLVGTAPPVEHPLVAVQLVGDCSSIDFHTRSENNQLKPLRHLKVRNWKGCYV